ncbi:DUF1573 domain-containing protein [Belliella aquatica]|uniref:DUF1573 domain-containing protein n=1 Tax=Belliella aquatica TaxID=1323734 RepID=A0ABQ1MKM7_9BACT|nr:DUF1573 domain-containing protein [Belliella aquatica]MCH7405401.1 DUF1573 domain-containing protein [Belliella aquatica]GGC41956.1 hypothetical protein GCM10010993_20650 [Belliella aquatica]
MKYLNLSALLLVGTIAVSSCSNNNDQAEKIAALEQKIAQMENSTTAVPANVQSTTAVDPSTLGAFKFEEVEFDFGTIAEGKIVEHVFSFVNDGQAPLVISNVTASCGCTTPDYTKTPVKPGDTGFVKVAFNSTGKPGTQAPTVSIQANTSPNVNRLRLKGNVTPKTTASAAGQFGPVKK